MQMTKEQEPQVMPANETASNGVVGLAEALQAMQKGKVAHLVDNGEGLALPGIVSCMPYPVLLQAMQTYAIPENEEVVSMEMLLVNMVPAGEGKWAVRHFRPRDFNGNSRWVIDEPAETEQTAKTSK